MVPNVSFFFIVRYYLKLCKPLSLRILLSLFLLKMLLGRKTKTYRPHIVFQIHRYLHPQKSRNIGKIIKTRAVIDQSLAKAFVTLETS